MTQLFTKHIRGFLVREDGAILIEFALVLPLMLGIFALTVESTRLMKTYQTTVAGVRDASRYLARTTPSDICDSGGSVSGMTTTLQTMVEKDISGSDLMPSQVTINSVTPSVSCVTGTYRVSPAPVAVVTASITLQFPLGGILELFGGNMSTITTTVTDQSRIFGQ